MFIVIFFKHALRRREANSTTLIKQVEKAFSETRALKPTLNVSWTSNNLEKIFSFYLLETTQLIDVFGTKILNIDSDSSICHV